MISLIITIAILGVVVWVITSLPMHAIFKTVIYAIVAIAVLYYFAAWIGHPIGRLPR